MSKIITYEYDNGDMYKGEYKDGLRNGQGKLFFKNGNIYKGEFKDNFMSGHGKLTIEGGAHYEGEFKNNKFHGYGKYTFENGTYYLGEFKRDRFHGQGILTTINGDVYNGEFKKDKYHGQFICIYNNGDIYVGGYKDGLKDGLGKLITKFGDEYVGNFKGGKFNGQGKYTLENGDFYEGEFKEGFSYNSVQNKKNQNVLLINNDETTRNIDSYKEKYAKVLLLEESKAMDANFLKGVITYSTKTAEENKKIKVFIDDHAQPSESFQEFLKKSLAPNKIGFVFVFIQKISRFGRVFWFVVFPLFFSLLPPRYYMHSRG